MRFSADRPKNGDAHLIACLVTANKSRNIEQRKTQTLNENRADIETWRTSVKSNTARTKTELDVLIGKGKYSISQNVEQLSSFMYKCDRNRL